MQKLKSFLRKNKKPSQHLYKVGGVDESLMVSDILVCFYLLVVVSLIIVYTLESPEVILLSYSLMTGYFTLHMNINI